MGMSASQMRYIMISGKKSDIEFQGQQINQQRTTLATESSTLNSSLLNMTVPTPPSSEDFTKITYTFESQGSTFTVNNLLYNTKEYYADDDKDHTGTKYPAGTYTLTCARDVVGTQAKPFSVTSDFKNENGQYIAVLGGASGSTNPLLKKVDLDNETGTEKDNDERALKYLRNLDIFQVPDGEPEMDFYKYENSSGVTKYIPATKIESLSDGATGQFTSYYIDDKAEYTEITKLYGCTDAKFSDSGRLTAVTYQESENDLPITLNMSVSTSVDDNAYKDAYNEYLFKKQEYEQKINEINAKLEVIQAQDKKLELKLSDLDTQQSAIQTEMDAVKKVIDKNIETTFKTFA